MSVYKILYNFLLIIKIILNINNFLIYKIIYNLIIIIFLYKLIDI